MAAGDKETTSAGSLIVANLGNTNMRLVGLEAGEIRWERRIPTLDLASGARVELEGDQPIVLASVVPAVAAALVAHWGPERVTLVGPERAPGLTVRYDPPGGLGADRLCNAVAVWRRWGWGVAIDCGTATTVTVVAPGGVLVGGAIMPGLGTARRSLASGTAQLMEVPLEAPEAPWGDSTLTSLQVGLVHGHVGAILHLVDRMRPHLPPEVPVALTGGWSHTLAPLLPGYAHVPDLTIEGAAAMGPSS